MDKKKIYMIFGIVLLIISIAGSAYSYYSLVGVNEDSVYGTASGSASMNLKVEKISTGAIGSLIPVDNDTTTLTKAVVGEANTNFDDNKRCIDKNGYAACQIYKATLTNKSSIDLVVNGGVSLKGDETPNIECAVMSDINTVADNTSCKGNKTLANNYTIKANESKIYYIMVYVKNLNKVQTDTGSFTGTIFFSADTGDKLKANFEPNKELLSDYITNLYTNEEKSTINIKPSTYYATITYNTVPSENLINDRLGGTTESLDGGNIRYYGSSPNNYIYFNCSDYSNQTVDTCELWRIIGVFDGKVKIIRNESIGTYSWDTSTNEWSQAKLMKLLNPKYDTESVGGSLYYNSSSGKCYNGYNNGTTSCDFRSTGIKNNITRNKIAEVTWNLGGYNNAASYLQEIYAKERSTSENDTTWIGKVALAYASDYGYAANLTSCNRNLFDYAMDVCTSNNWMYNILKDGWLLTKISGSDDNVFFVSSSGSSSMGNASNAKYDARRIIPTVFLNSDETIVEGTTGTEDNPYKLNP